MRSRTVICSAFALAGCTPSYETAIECASTFRANAEASNGDQSWLAEHVKRQALRIGEALGKSETQVLADLRTDFEREKSERAALDASQLRERLRYADGPSRRCWNLYQ